MVNKLTFGLGIFLGLNCVIKAEADAKTKRDDFGRVVDHGKVKKYFLELYNEALVKAVKEQEDKEIGINDFRNSEKRGMDFGIKGFSGYEHKDAPSFSGSKFPKFSEFKKSQQSYDRDIERDNDHEHGFTGLDQNSVRSQIQHTSHRRGGHHHKHNHHKHDHQHTNDHKHAHKHLHDQSHEHKHSAKHQHVHKHEHHHEHNHHHKHKEDHEHKQDHKHAHKHLHAHKGNSWRRQGDEEDYLNRRQDTQTNIEPINAHTDLEENVFVPIGSQNLNLMKKLVSPPEYQDIEYDAWEQI